MSIVIVSRGPYCPGQKVAKKVAEILGYEYLSRDILMEASEEFDVSELKLLRALRDAPSIFDHLTSGKERYMAYIETTMLEHLQKDNVVYYGLDGHYFVRGIAHVLKARILGNMEDRLKVIMEREEVFEQAASAMNGVEGNNYKLPKSHRDVSKDRALRLLEDMDEARRKWGLLHYGMEPGDARLYDLSLQINRYSTDDAADMICRTVKLPHFKTTPESQKALDNLVLNAQVKSSIIHKWHNVEVSSEDGKVVIHIEAPIIQESLLCEQIIPLVKDVPGVRDAKVHVRPATFLGTC